jgi:cephalosporin-C deacetylase-like acetyl esterase
MSIRMRRVAAVVVVAIFWSAATCWSEDPLPGTQPLKLSEPLDVVMTRGLRAFAKRELAHARQTRNAPWMSAGEKAKDAARLRLRKIIGLPAELESHPTLDRINRHGTTAAYGIAAGQAFSIEPYRWDAFEGVSGRCLSTGLRNDPNAPLVVIIPDADQTPEQLFGLAKGLPETQQIGKLFAESGGNVLCPLLIDRDCTFSGHEGTKWTNLPHREYIYRLGFDLGLHPVGMEVAKVVTAVRAFNTARGTKRDQDSPATLLIGTGEGGLIALCAAAIEPELFDGVLIAGYFGQQTAIWEQPIYRNLFGSLIEFGDAELGSLFAPRQLLIDISGEPLVSGPPTMADRASVAAPGVLGPTNDALARDEFQRLQSYYRQAGAANACQIMDSLGTDEVDTASKRFMRIMKQRVPRFSLRTGPSQPYEESRVATPEFLSERMRSQVLELVRYTQLVLDRSDNARSASWKKVDPKNLDTFQKSIGPFASWVHESFIGKLAPPTVAPNPRTRKILEEPTHHGYEVVLDVYPAPASRSQASASAISSELNDPGVLAGGILLLPKDLQPGEKRPVVVCQHGLEGIPMDTISEDRSTRAWAAYKGFATELARRGFIVYAPQNPYRGHDDFRVIQRMSNPVGRSLFSYIIEQHRQTLRWLASLPGVDRDRIGFYGLSYGGKTAVRVPTLLAPSTTEPGYCLSICSGDFNEWIRKNSSADDRYSYVYTPEYEIFEWDMGHVANYAELSWLMIPRPFMVERGHDDGVAPDEWVAGEFAKVRRVYDKLGIGEKTEIEFFNGPHTINGQGTYRFLHRHLNWPEKR